MMNKILSPKLVATSVADRQAVAGSALPEQVVSSKQQTPSENFQIAGRSFSFAVAQFNDLPGCAFVRQPTVLALFACSKASLWRWVKSGRLPAPKKLGLRVSAWNVGQLRACLENLQQSGQVNSIEGGKL